MKKALWLQENVASWFIAPMEKEWFYKILFFEVVIVMVKEKKYSIKDTVPIKFSFMHYMQWTRVMLPVVFEEFENDLYVFTILFFFSLSLSIGKRSTTAKIWGEI